MNINPQDILALLGPGTGANVIWSIFLYLIFFFALVALFTMPNKNMIPTLLIAAVLVFSIVAKLSIGAINARQTPILRPGEFGMFVINAGMFALPFIAVGMTRVTGVRKRGSNRAAAPAMLTGLLGGLYFFIFWFFYQQTA
jgi:hypothetical protein